MKLAVKLAGVILFLLTVVQDVEAQSSPWSAQEPSGCSDQYGAFDAFIPGMRGKGSCNRGGFVPGTNVIVVTNRNSSGSGSFAAAVQADCPKVILFGIAGSIPNSANPLQVANCDNWSIVGESAPGNITLTGSNGQQFMTHGNHFTIGHMTITSGNNDDALLQGGMSQGTSTNGLVYNSTFLWAPQSSAVSCYTPVGQEQTNITYWQDLLAVGTTAVGLHELQNTCTNLDTIRTMYIDSQARVPLVRSDGYFHANNVHVNMQNDFSRVQPCDGGIYGSQPSRVQMEFVNNAYAEGPASNSAGNAGYIRLWDSTSCTTFSLWETGTVAMSNPGNIMRNCTNHGCTGGLSGHLAASEITSVSPTGYVPETISNSQQGLTDFATLIGTYVGARPNDRFTYIQNKIDFSINAIDGSGATSSWSAPTTIAAEGGVSQVEGTPQSGYDPTDGAENPCGEDMPIGNAADVIQSSGLTRLHEWVIGCFGDNVMPAGYREDKLQNYSSPTGGGSGPPPTRPQPPTLQN